MTDARATTVNLEVLVSGSPDARATTVNAETLVAPTTPEVRESSTALAVLSTPTPDVRASSTALAVLTPAFTGYTAAVHQDSPLAYYRLGDASGTAMTDSSGALRNGTYVGTPTLGVTGLISSDSDTAVTFASGKYATVTYATWMNATSITVEALIKMTSYPGAGAKAIIFTRDDESTLHSFSFHVNENNKLEAIFYISGTPYTVTGSTSLSTDTPYHGAFTYNGSVAKIYLGGVEDGSTTQAGTLDTVAVNTRIAASPNANRYPFIGTLDEIAFYGTALSSTRIAAHADTLTAPATVSGFAVIAIAAAVPQADIPLTVFTDTAPATAAVPDPTVQVGSTVSAACIATTTTVPPATTPNASLSASTVVATSAVYEPASFVPPGTAANISVGAVAETPILSYDFETTNETDWPVHGSNWYIASRSSDQAHGGTYSMLLQRNGNSSAGLGYALDAGDHVCDPYTDYEVRVWVKATTSTSYNFDITAGYSFTRIASHPFVATANTWVEISYTFNSGNNSVYGLLFTDDGNATPTAYASIYVDDLTITPVHATQFAVASVPLPSITADNATVHAASVAAPASVNWSVPDIIVKAPTTLAAPIITYDFVEGTVEGFTTHGAAWDVPAVTTDFSDPLYGVPYTLKLTRNTDTPGDGYALNTDAITLTPYTDYWITGWACSNQPGWVHDISVIDGGTTVAVTQMNTQNMGQWWGVNFTFNSGAHTSVHLRVSDDPNAAPRSGDILQLKDIRVWPYTGPSIQTSSWVFDGTYKEVQITADNAVIRVMDWEAPYAWATIVSPPMDATVSPSTVVTIATLPLADNGHPPGPVTGLTATPVGLYSIELAWTNPVDASFDHVLLLRNDSMPWATPGDELLDPSIVAITPSGLGDVGNSESTTAWPITTGTFTLTQDTTGRPNTGPGGTRYTPGAWYVYTPISDGTITVSTIGTTLDTFLYVFDQTAITILASNDDGGRDHGGAQYSSWLQLAVTAGNTYYILAQGYDDTVFGPDMVVNLSGPGSSQTPPAPLPPTYVDTGLLSGHAYFYSMYSVNVFGAASTAGVHVSATPRTIDAAAPMPISVTLLAGTFAITAATPLVPDPGAEIDYYGYPLKSRLTMLAGTTWSNDLTQPPPARPGSTTGFPLPLFPPGTDRTPTDIRVELWNKTNTAKVADLNYSAARQFLDEYNGVGSGTLQIPSIVTEEADLLKRDYVLRFYYKDIAEPVFASVIEGRKTSVIAEAGAHWTVVNGRGLLSWLEDAVVLPYVDENDILPMTGLLVKNSEQPTRITSNIMESAPDVRAFNFGSRDAPAHALFDDLGPGSSGNDPSLNAVWNAPACVMWSARTDHVKGYPNIKLSADPPPSDVPAPRPRPVQAPWADPSAYWIWITNPQADVADGLTAYFRGEFTLTEDVDAVIMGAADNYADFYLDGELLFHTSSWKEWTYLHKTIKAGNHFLQIVGVNGNIPTTKYNPAGVIASISGPSGVIFRTEPTTYWQVTLTPQTFDYAAANKGPGWHRPLGMAQSTPAPMNIKALYPTDWPDPTAKWIWGSSPELSSPEDELCWFRAKVWIEATGTYRWFITADNGYYCWIDGIEVLSLDYQGDSAKSWMRYDTLDVDFTRGYHVFAIRGRNQAGTSNPGSNPAGVIGALMELDQDRKPTIPVQWVSTDTTGQSGGDVWAPNATGWFSNWSGPAWKAGDVLYTLINEAKGRDVTRLQNVEMTFTPEKDSNGVDWTTRVSRTWDVGTPLLQVAFDLCELGVDIWMTPDNKLHCAERRGKADATFSVEYGVNISGYDVDETFSGASVAYTRTRTGWYTLKNDTSNLILGGNREAGISLANTTSEDQMVDISRRAIGAVVMANMVATAQAIIPVPGSIPWVDANISDIINVLSPNGKKRMGRLLSISVAENEAGATTWVPEIEIWSSPFGDGVDPNRPYDPVDPNDPYDSSTWVPAADDWTRFVPEGSGSDAPRPVTQTVSSGNPHADGGGSSSQSPIPRPTAAPTGMTPLSGAAEAPVRRPTSYISPSPAGATPTPLNSAQAPRPPYNSENITTSPDSERVAIKPTAPLLTAGYHLWVDTTGVV